MYTLAIFDLPDSKLPVDAENQVYTHAVPLSSPFLSVLHEHLLRKFCEQLRQ